MRIDRKNGPKVRGGTAGTREGEEREENKGKLTGLQSQSQLDKKNQSIGAARYEQECSSNTQGG